MIPTRHDPPRRASRVATTLMKDKAASMPFTARWGLVLLTLSTTFSCRGSVVAPAVALDRTVSAARVDGQALPFVLQAGHGEANHLTRFEITFAADGLWTAVVLFFPDGATETATVQANDNGWYRFDGNTLRMHSNFSGTDWPGSVHGDTVTISAKLPIADAFHTVLLP